MQVFALIAGNQYGRIESRFIMFCTNCGQKLPDVSNISFCPKCGKQVTKGRNETQATVQPIGKRPNKTVIAAAVSILLMIGVGGGWFLLQENATRTLNDYEAAAEITFLEPITGTAPTPAPAPVDAPAAPAPVDALGAPPAATPEQQHPLGAIPAYITIGDRQISTSETELVLYNDVLTNTDIIPLQYMVNLISLELWNNQISDLAPLAGLTNLTFLVLHANQVNDLTPLAGLTNLTSLELWDHQVSDLIPLAGLTNLTFLVLHGYQIGDLAPLAGLSNLTWLRLLNSQISDITPIAGLTNLTWLDLRGNQINDLTPFAGLTNLTRLYLHHRQITEITDWSPVAHVENVLGRP